MNFDANMRLARICYGTLVLFYILFIAAASFYITGKIPSTEKAVSILLEKGGAFSFNFHNLRDVATNILLYLPFGFLVAFHQSCIRDLKIVSLYLLGGLILSLLVETSQAFIGRYSDFADVVSNASGYAAGYLVAYVAIKHFKLSPIALLGVQKESDDVALRSISGLRFVYIAISFITCLLPLNVTVSLSVIYSKLTPVNNSLPRIILDPLYHLSSTSTDIKYLVFNTALFLPLAFFSSHIQIKREQGNLLTPAFHCLSFGFLIEISNVFIKSGRSDILIPFVGFFIGAVVSYLTTKFYHISEKNRSSELDMRYLWMTAALFYSLILFSLALSPFEFELSIKALKQKFLFESNIIPFKAHFSARSISAAIDIVREVLQYIPLGALIGLSVKNNRQVVYSGLIGFSLALFIELLQLSVVGRYVDLTDCLLAASGSVIGSLVLPLFKRTSHFMPTGDGHSVKRDNYAAKVSQDIVIKKEHNH